MSWTYRVVKRMFAGENSFGIYEAYDDGDINKPHSITELPVDCCGGTLDELRENYKLVAKAFDLPVLNYEDF